MSSETDAGTQNDLVEQPGPTLDDDTEGEDEDDVWPHGRQLVEHEPPRMKVGKVRQWWRTWRWLKKRRKLIGDGYVKWKLIGDSVNRAKFIKPERKGGGIPEYEHEGETYLFPPGAKVPSEDGLWVFMHRRGEADPINIRDPARLSLPADELKEYLDLRVSASAPGFFDSLGIDVGDMIKIMVGLIIAYAVFQQVMGGGL